MAFAFPDLSSQIASVEVRVTSFGTGSSYSFHQTDETANIIIYWRQDMDISHLAEAILSAILSSTHSRYSENWEDTERCVDMLLTTSRLVPLFPHYQPTLGKLLRQTTVQEHNRQYLAQLGCPFRKVSFTHHNGLLTLDGKPADTFLGPKEILVLELLLQSSGKITTYDAIGDVLWDDTQEFSLWAINRCLSRLREKLRKQQLPCDIQNIRGQGYFFTFLETAKTVQ